MTEENRATTNVGFNLMEREWDKAAMTRRVEGLWYWSHAKFTAVGKQLDWGIHHVRQRCGVHLPSTMEGMDCFCPGVPTCVPR